MTWFTIEGHSELWGVELVGVPQELASGWVVATGRRLETGEVYLFAQFVGAPDFVVHPILEIPFSRGEWDRLVEGT